MHVLLQEENINFLSFGLPLHIAPIVFGDWMLRIMYRDEGESSGEFHIGASRDCRETCWTMMEFLLMWYDQDNMMSWSTEELCQNSGHGNFL